MFAALEPLCYNREDEAIVRAARNRRRYFSSTENQLSIALAGHRYGSGAVRRGEKVDVVDVQGCDAQRSRWSPRATRKR